MSLKEEIKVIVTHLKVRFEVFILNVIDSTRYHFYQSLGRVYKANIRIAQLCNFTLTDLRSPNIDGLQSRWWLGYWQPL